MYGFLCADVTNMMVQNEKKIYSKNYVKIQFCVRFRLCPPFLFVKCLQRCYNERIITTGLTDQY